MSDCFSATQYGNSTASLQVETAASSFFALPYHQLERVDFISADGTDTVIVSFVTCTVRITGKQLRLMASKIAKQQVESINTMPKKSPPPEKNSACVEKIEVVEKENAT
ncbi:MAG: hypothetical protein ABR955_12075 [Verrucomicrobiota bacterium]|jgi:hypothetical protein